MNLYPYRLTVLKNVKAAMVPVVAAQAYIYYSRSVVPLEGYLDGVGAVVAAPPLLSDFNGRLAFWAPPGRYRLDVQLDAVVVESLEIALPDVPPVQLPPPLPLPSAVRAITGP